jgi:large subunit ribosomal protein L17
MRHSKVINHLGRTSSHRKAMLANMATSLILHKRITTTTAKAKALRTYVEPLITKSKEDSTHSRRVVFSYLKDKTAVAELFRDISPKIGERPGGYTRILKLGNRIGDNADMCILELVDYNEAMLGGEAAKTKTTRRRRSTKKKDEAASVTAAPKVSKVKAAKAEEPVKEAGEAKEDAVPQE